MQFDPALRFASPQSVRRQRPAMPVGRHQDRRLEIDPQVVPQTIRRIEIALRGIAQKVAETTWLGRVQKPEQAPLVLSEASPREWAEKASSYGMQGPTVCEHCRQLGRSTPLHLASNSLSQYLGRFGTAVALDRARQKIDLLVSVRVYWQIDKSSLNFCPLIPRVPGQAVGVFLERLMQDADNEQSAAAARGHFRQLLKQMDIRSIPGGAFQKLSELVDEYREATTGARMAHGDLLNCLEHGFLRPGRRHSVGLQQASLCDRFTDDLGRSVAPARHRQHAPAAASGREGFQEKRRDLLSHDGLCFALQVCIAVQQSA
ncbi:MAG: hypothetical protein OXQ29_02180 [Rhodospirillaceae bacterium]|nr:hypothetical protein [Rhodospirillaceae bacterium]